MIFAQLALTPALGFSNVIMLLFSLAFVIVLAIYVTKLVAGAKLRGFGKNLKIIESIGVGQNNSVLLLKVGEKYILIGTGKDSVNLLCNIDEHDIVLEERQQTPDFKNMLNNFIRGNKNETSN
ncbi:MAG: flagellar biosynthetic protein FliO [Defluviitaleaceae bacterium]|nr:flagellar biosynthetic protein FliO [Defluviitaleaceae bacterium]